MGGEEGGGMEKAGVITTIGQLLPELQAEERPLPVVGESASVSEIIDTFAASRHSRLLYVLNDQGRLVGVISFGRMVRHVFFHYNGRDYDNRGLVHMAFSENARDFMERGALAAKLDDRIEDVLARMLDHNVKEVPVLDDEGRVLADLTMADLLPRFR